MKRLYGISEEIWTFEQYQDKIIAKIKDMGIT